MHFFPHLFVAITRLDHHRWGATQYCVVRPRGSLSGSAISFAAGYFISRGRCSRACKHVRQRPTPKVERRSLCRRATVCDAPPCLSSLTLRWRCRSHGGPLLCCGWFRVKFSRYMSPEVARALPANETADCYSFAMVMWEMISLELPFQFYGVKELVEQ